MPDAESLAAFADLIRGVLPRVLLYPGGLFAAVVAGLLALALSRLSREHRPATTNPAREGEAIAGLAFAWAGLALLPLPGVTPFPGAPDLLTPLGLLLAASLLLRFAMPNPAAWRPEAAGRMLMLAAPLVALAALGGDGLLPPADVSGSIMAGAARVLAALAYAAGFCVCYAAPGSAPWSQPGTPVVCAAAWFGWLGWLGIGVVHIPLAWINFGNPTWSGAVMVALLAALAGAALITAPARAVSRRPAWGWAALGLALLAVLLN